jgi:deoxyribonuclease-4
MAQDIFIGTAGIPASAKGSGAAEGVRRVAELGLTAMEVEFVYGVNMGAAAAKELGEAAREAGVRLSVHAPYYVNLCTDDRAKLAASKKRIMDSAERAEAMHAGVIVFHPGFYGKLDKAEAFDRVAAACTELSDNAPKNVKLGLETTGKSGAFGTLDEIVEICKSVHGCVPVVDFAHVYARQGGKIDYGKVFDALEPLKLPHLHSHFSGIEYTQKGERMHLPVGKPAFKPLAQEILKRKLGITLVCESPLLEMDALRMKRVLELLGHGF